MDLVIKEEEVSVLKKTKELSLLAKKARSDGERAAIIDQKVLPGEACCKSCGWGNLPFRPAEDEDYRHCSHWRQMKHVDVFCMRYSHTDHTNNRVVPWWIDVDTKKRYGAGEMAKKIQAQESRGVFIYF